MKVKHYPNENIILESKDVTIEIENNNILIKTNYYPINYIIEITEPLVVTASIGVTIPYKLTFYYKIGIPEGDSLDSMIEIYYEFYDSMMRDYKQIVEYYAKLEGQLL